MILGRVDEVDGSYVGTRFLAGAVPLRCMYITHTSGRVPEGLEELPLRTSWRSIVLGYLRVWAPMLAVAALGADLACGGVHRATIALAGLLLGASAVAHRAGRLSSNEKARLRLLGSVTGLRLDPALLPTATREAKRASLEALMSKGGIPSSASSILAVIDGIPTPALPLVYGYARYAGDDEPWVECAAVVFRRHEDGAF